MITNIQNGIGNALNGVSNNNRVEGQKKEAEKIIETKEVSRVEEIKKEIEAGTYKVDIQKTAEAVAQTLI